MPPERVDRTAPAAAVRSLPRPTAQPRELIGLLTDADPGTRILAGAPGDCRVSGIELDSRLVQPGDLFVACPGQNSHGATHADAAIRRGARALLSDAAGLALIGSAHAELPRLCSDHPRRSCARLAAALYRRAPDPALLAVTGTNGKTSTVQMLHAALNACGIGAGVIGTLGIEGGAQRWHSPLTTPEAPQLQGALGAFAERGVQAVALEVSSAALIQERISTLRFAVAGFTHLDRDHLDLHGSMRNYLEAKASLFHPMRCERAVVMVDDAAGRWIAERCRQHGLPLLTCSSGPEPADWRLCTEGDRWLLRMPDGERLDLGGRERPAFHRRNQLLAFAMLAAADLCPPAAVLRQAIAERLGALRLPGRMQTVSRPDDPILAVVDYAHTAGAIQEATAEMRRLVRRRLITLVCADGERDPGKRHDLGATAAAGSDVLIVTETSNRGEDPARIRAALLAGARSVGWTASGTRQLLEIPERAAAIEAALGLARDGDGILLLGRAHEACLDNAGERIPFLDSERLEQALRRHLDGQRALSR